MNTHSPTLTLTQLRSVLADLGTAAATPGGLSTAAVRELLARHELTDVPFGVAAALVDAVRGSGASMAATSIPLKQLEELLQRIG